MNRRGMGLWAAATTLVGLALLVWVLQRTGARLDLDALRSSWPLPVVAALWFVIPLAAASQSWRLLFPGHGRPPPGAALRLTWIGLGVNWLLPVATIGGEVVKYRLGRQAGWRGERLAASLVADKTLQVSTQILYLLIGAALLLGMTGKLNWQLGGLLWLTGFAGSVALFYRMQNAGMFSGLLNAFARAGGDADARRAGSRRIDAAIRRVYRRRGALLRAIAWRMAFRILVAGEIALVIIGLAWMTGTALPAPVASVGGLLGASIVLESLTQGARAMAFFIPAGLGAQEGALIGAGLLLGLPAETLLLVALVKRARELTVGGAGLAAWQLSETRRLVRP